MENCLFGAVTLTRNTDIDQYKYSGYVIGFDRHGFFSIGNGAGRNLIIFGVDMSSSPHIDNKKKYILILRKDPTQRLEYTLSAYNVIPVHDILDIYKYLMKKNEMFGFIKMFDFIKEVLVSAMMFFSCSVVNVNLLKCFSMNNEECKIRPLIININSNEQFVIHIQNCGVLMLKKT